LRQSIQNHVTPTLRARRDQAREVFELAESEINEDRRP
jgi:hypothetical protein